MPWIEPLSLENNICRLLPLSHDYLDALLEVMSDGEVWKLFYSCVPHPNDMEKEISRRLELQSKGAMLPFTVINDKFLIVFDASFFY